MKKKINIIIPAYNEAENIAFIISEIDKYTKGLNYSCEYIFIDDGSTDNTYNKIVELSNERSDINVIKLSRNFGKESALCAGVNFCDCDAAIIIDADLQHPPYLIPSLIYEWEKSGANIVDAVKISRQKESILNKIFSSAFYKIMKILTNINFSGSSDYKLIDRKAIKILNSLDEKNRFFRGLTNWV